MATWVMQYRTKGAPGDKWTEWKNLPASLTFSEYYSPHYFEFRAIVESGSRAFVFRGSAEDES